MEAIAPNDALRARDDVEEAVVPRRRGARRAKRVKAAKWSALGIEVWAKVICYLDGLSLYAMMFVSHRFEELVNGSPEAWQRAGFACLPHAWGVLAKPGLKYSASHLDVRLFLKYAILLERFSAQALISSSFSPYCLKSTGVSIAALAKALPPAHQGFQQAILNTPSHAPIQTTLQRDRQTKLSRQGLSAHLELQQDPIAVSRPSQLFEILIDHPPRSDTRQNNHIEAQEVQKEEIQGGEDLSFVDPDIAIADTPHTPSKSHNSLHRSLSKLKKVIGFMHKTPKANLNSQPNNVKLPPLSPLSLSHSSAKKRHLHFEEPLPLDTALSGADEAWFGLPDPKNLIVTGLALGRWRVMSEVNLLVNTMSVFRLNPKVVTVGAYIVRRLCYLESPAFVGEVGSIRNRLSNTAIVEILLEALETFKKDAAVVAAVLVALGNLALEAFSACAIGDRGLGLIARVMKRHRAIPKIIEYSIFLLLNVCDTRIEYKKKLRDLEMPQFIVKELTKFVQSIRMMDRQHPKAQNDAKTTAPKVYEALTTSLKGAITSWGSVARQRSHSEVSSSPNASTDQSSLVDSQGAAAGGSERSIHSDSSVSVPDLVEIGEGSVEEMSEEMVADEGEAPSADEVVDERASAWMMKIRPSLAVLHLELIQHRPADLQMIGRLLDMLCVLSADYDILKTDLALKSASLIGDLIVMLFGSPWPSVDALVTSAFRCLLVIYEWDVHHRDWTSCERFVHSLLILARAFVKARIRLPYATNCYLVIFSLVWKGWEQNSERKELISLILASLRLEQLFAPSSPPNPSSSNQNANQSPPPLLIPAAAMLGDMAHSFYSIRTHIRDAGGLQLLRAFRDGLEGEVLLRLDDFLDEFEDNPLLRGRHRRGLNQDQAAPEDAPLADPVAI